jgi:hypothetical protein
MTYTQRTLSFLTVLLSLTGAAGCDSGSSNGAPKLVAQGRVESNLDDSNTTVTASTIASDGSREPVEMDATMTDANGRYRVESPVELSAGSHLLLEATDGTNRASVVLLVEADGEMTAEPMNEETSLEAAVFESLSASTSCDACSHDAVRAHLGTEAATTFAAGSETESTLADVSAALEARIDAEATVLTDESDSAFNTYVTARANAQADEVAALDAATSVSATAEARAAYEAALVEARSSGSLSTETWAVSAHAGAEAMRLEATSLDVAPALYAQLVADAELTRAVSVQAAMEAELAASGATDVNLDATFTTLLVAIESARTDGVMAGVTITDAWTAAALAIRVEIASSLDAGGTAAFDLWATFSTTTVAALRASVVLMGVSSVETAVLFSEGVADATVDVTALTAAGIDADMANAFASVLLHAELAASAE